MSTALIVVILVVLIVAAGALYWYTRPPKGLYAIEPEKMIWNGTNYSNGKNYADAVATVTALGGVIPTRSQLAAAFALTWDQCRWGWFVDDSKDNTPTAMFATHNTEAGCFGGGLVTGSTNVAETWCVYGYGPKPESVPDSLFCIV
jgi:hypothetical protein